MVAVVQSNETSRRRALVVDDSHIARHVLSGMLDRLGFEVDTVDSAEAALNRTARYLPDVIFMDHLLPGMQGLEAVRKLRSRTNGAGVRIVMFTSQDGELFADVARAAGADDVFVKTSDHRLLDDILARLDLLPRAPDETGPQGNVVALPSNRKPVGASPALEAVLEPILDQHREKLRQDLLSEFAILERYEERMRKDTIQQIEAVAERAIRAIDTSMLERRRAQEAGRKRIERRIMSGVALVGVLSLALAAAFIA